MADSLSHKAGTLLNFVCYISIYLPIGRRHNVFARHSIGCKRAYAIAIPSVRLSVCHTGGSVKNG